MVVLAKSTGASITSTLLSQPPPTTTQPRGAASPLVVHRESKDVCVYIPWKIYGCFEGDIDRCNINKLENMFTLSLSRVLKCREDISRRVFGIVLHTPMQIIFRQHCHCRTPSYLCTYCELELFKLFIVYWLMNYFSNKTSNPSWAFISRW